jgi:hypothetical protein
VFIVFLIFLNEEIANLIWVPIQLSETVAVWPFPVNMIFHFNSVFQGVQMGCLPSTVGFLIQSGIMFLSFPFGLNLQKIMQILGCNQSWSLSTAV